MIKSLLPIVRPFFDSFKISAPNGTRTLAPRTAQVDSYRLQHGDMLYMVPLSEDLFPAAAAAAAAEAMETQSEPESKASSTAGAGTRGVARPGTAVVARTGAAVVARKVR